RHGESDRGGQNALADVLKAPFLTMQSFFFRRFQEPLNGGQQLIHREREVASRFKFLDLGRNRQPDLFPSCYSRSGDRVRPLQRSAHYLQLCSTRPAKLARLRIFLSALWTKHSASNQSLVRWAISKGSCPAAVLFPPGITEAVLQALSATIA